MDNRHYTIGQMAKLTNLPSQTLRYYDQIDLFKPIYTDPATNYRYYAESQLYLIDLIKSLRFVGTPLEKIKEIQHFSIEEMIDYLNKQEKTLANKLAQLQETQYTLRKTRKQMEEQLAIPVLNEIFTKHEESARLLCLTAPNATPEHVSNDEMRKLTETIENEGSVQTIRYGSYYPLKRYKQIEDIQYTQIFIPILTSKLFHVQNEAMNIVTMPEGKYIEMAFIYTSAQYIQMYEKLWQYIQTKELYVEEVVWESIMPMSFSTNVEEKILVELKVRLLD